MIYLTSSFHCHKNFISRIFYIIIRLHVVIFHGINASIELFKETITQYEILTFLSIPLVFFLFFSSVQLVLVLALVLVF